MIKRKFVYVKLCQLTLYLHCTLLVHSKDWNDRKVYLKCIEPPERVSVLERNPVRVYCGSTSPVNWTHNSSPLAFTSEGPIDAPVHSRHEIGHKEITLIGLLENDTGYYICQGKYYNTLFKKFIHVLVMKHPEIGLVAPSLMEASRGGSVTLHCGSAGSVEWFSVHYQNQTKFLRGNSLTLYHLRKEHTGVYVCRGRPERTTTRRTIFHAKAIIFVDNVIQRMNRSKDETWRSSLLGRLRARYATLTPITQRLNHTVTQRSQN